MATVSILLACIAEKLGLDGNYRDWTRPVIFRARLTNPDAPRTKLRKLKLQDGEEEEYRRILEGSPEGAGAVTQAWRIIRRFVAQNDVGKLLTGLDRFRVVSIGLDSVEDPQQVFESLNATGRPLTESEKVKNWLLMGLPGDDQQDLHDTHWRNIEAALNARDSTELVDTFLRGVLRWRTGSTRSESETYAGLRRWAIKTGRTENTENMKGFFEELAKLARLYGILTGTAGKHKNSKVERELAHLRSMGIDSHRPLTLRLLNDADRGISGATDAVLSEVFALISSWTTRLWLANRPTHGLNTAFVRLAHTTLSPDDDYVEFWRGQISGLRNQSVGVPDGAKVCQGVRSRKAYGGSATRTASAILCALMEAEHGDAAPARSTLTIEHIMPRTLTPEWRDDLGEDAEELHGEYCNRLPNLTLSGDVTNSRMGARPFDQKRKDYENNPIGLTRRIADEDRWDREALERRAECLARRVLDRWPWSDPVRPKPMNEVLRWRINGGTWHVESHAYKMVLGVVG